MEIQQYKPGHVRKVVLLTMIAFIALVTQACGRTLEYETFEHIRDWETDFASITEKEEGVFLIYSYAVWCPACAEIKEDVLAFADDAPRGYNTYLLDVSNIRGEWPFEPGGTSIPRMFVIEEGELVDEVVGMFDIPELLDEIRGGDYAP